MIFGCRFSFLWFIGSHTGRGSCDFWSLCALRSVIFLVLFGCYELAIVSLSFRFICDEISRICMHFSV